MESIGRPIEVARESAAAPTRKRLKADLKKLPRKLKLLRKFHEYLTDHLLERGLTITSAREAVGLHDNGASSTYRRYMGKPPKKYLRDRRLEVAERLLREFGFLVGEVSDAVGYDNSTTFSDSFEKWCGSRPNDVRGKARPLLDYPTYSRVIGGLADDEEGQRVLAVLLPLLGGKSRPSPGFRDGPRQEHSRAAELWEDIREETFEEQQVLVRWHPFRTTALFDLLRKTSRQEGRKDRQLGIRLAELALASLDGCIEAWGVQRRHDLRALGLAELGNARRLAFDLPGAEAEFAAAWAEWRFPRENRDPLVEAEICFLHGTLRMFQRRYDEALELVNKSLSLFEEREDSRGRAQVLMQRAAIRTYTDQLEDAVFDLRESATLIDEESDPYFAFGVSVSLANVMARAGKYEESLQELSKSKAACLRTDYPLGISEIEWVEALIRHETGDLSLAENLYSSARTTFGDAEEIVPTALSSLDLTTLYIQQGRTDDAIELASTTIPMLQSLKLHPETLQAIAMLTKAVSTKEVSRSLVRRVSKAIRQDPLSLLV